METRNPQSITTDYSRDTSLTSSSNLGAVSWGAIFAGAAAAAALSLILLLLGTGLGFTAVSPWAYDGISATTFGVSTILWITLTSLVASGIGGYIAGRLRTRWLATHSDEVYFRDTAHGFIAWAIATLATATLLTSVISAIVSGAAQAGATIVGGAAAATATAAASTDVIKSDTDKSLPYFLDSLFRKNVAAPSAATTGTATATAGAPVATNTVNVSSTSENTSDASKAEVTRIFVNAIANNTLPAADITYASHLLAEHAGITPQEAEVRIKDTFNLFQTKLRDAEVAARAAADKARKATAYGSLWLFISLLAGAFVASYSAIHGGRQRDL
jgi:hypothetical protein